MIRVCLEGSQSIFLSLSDAAERILGGRCDRSIQEETGKFKWSDKSQINFRKQYLGTKADQNLDNFEREEITTFRTTINNNWGSRVISSCAESYAGFWNCSKIDAILLFQAQNVMTVFDWGYVMMLHHIDQKLLDNLRTQWTRKYWDDATNQQSRILVKIKIKYIVSHSFRIDMFWKCWN